MLDVAKRDGYAYPAVNVSSSSTLNAALAGFAQASSDGIVQFTPSGAAFASGPAKDAAAGALAIAAFAREVGDRYPVLVALHTDHCPPARVDDFLRPLPNESLRRAECEDSPAFQSHMFDGSSLPLEENLDAARELLETCRVANVVLELEIGVVGGEEDGLDGRGVADEHMYSKPEEAIAVVERLGAGERGRYLLAATFGNVHGVYAGANAKLRPEVLRALRDAVVDRYGTDAAFDFVFHGGSGSSRDQIEEAISYGVVKFNLDTDLQYAYTLALPTTSSGTTTACCRLTAGPGTRRPTTHAPGAKQQRRRWRAGLQRPARCSVRADARCSLEPLRNKTRARRRGSCAVRGLTSRAVPGRPETARVDRGSSAAPSSEAGTSCARRGASSRPGAAGRGRA
jgi:fructose-bisphosphate aldolase, class II